MGSDMQNGSTPLEGELEIMAERLRQLLATEDYLPTLGALTGNQAVQQVKAVMQAAGIRGAQANRTSEMRFGTVQTRSNMDDCTIRPALRTRRRRRGSSCR